MTAGLHVQSYGEGTPVVLLHSFGLSGGQWRRLAPELAQRGMRAVVPDLTGHGASPPWVEPEPFSFRTDVARVVELLRSLGRAHVVGHSYGGLIALHAAVAVPDAILSLSAYEPVTFGVLDPVADADARETIAGVSLRWGETPDEHEACLCEFVDFWGGQGAWGALKEPARAEFRRVGWVVCEGVRSLVRDTTPANAFAVLKAPMHLVAGERSPLAGRRVVQRLGEAIGGARVTTVAAVGHMGPVTDAAVVHPVLVDLLSNRRSP